MPKGFEVIGCCRRSASRNALGESPAHLGSEPSECLGSLPTGEAKVKNHQTKNRVISLDLNTNATF